MIKVDRLDRVKINYIYGDYNIAWKIIVYKAQTKWSSEKSRRKMGDKQFIFIYYESRE